MRATARRSSALPAVRRGVRAAVLAGVRHRRLGLALPELHLNGIEASGQLAPDVPHHWQAYPVPIPPEAAAYGVHVVPVVHDVDPIVHSS